MFENRDADVLVIDQTYNPGGLTSYALDFYRIFLTESKPSLVSFQSADQKNYLQSIDEANSESNESLRQLKLQFATLFEEARMGGRNLTDAIPLGSNRKMVEPYEDMKSGPDKYFWNKPIMILTNPQAGSCGDVFPHLMAQNGVAKVYGERTGGWGGNVEDYTLPHSQGSFRVTRSLFVSSNGQNKYEDYDKSILVENHGQAVSIGLNADGTPSTPNPFSRPLRESDLDDGFTQYLIDFSTVASKL
jgi:hypothetical protein